MNVSKNTKKSCYCLPGEVWLPVKGFPHLVVSNFGRIQSLYSTARWGNAGRILKTRINRGGYEFINLYKSGRVISKRVHKIVAEAFIGPTPIQDGKQLFVDHKDGNRANNNLSNLRYLTRIENTARGIKQYNSKINPQQVREIRDKRAKGMTLVGIAKQYNINHSTVKDVCQRKTWRHVV